MAKETEGGTGSLISQGHVVDRVHTAPENLGISPHNAVWCKHESVRGRQHLGDRNTPF